MKNLFLLLLLVLPLLGNAQVVGESLAMDKLGKTETEVKNMCPDCNQHVLDNGNSTLVDSFGKYSYIFDKQSGRCIQCEWYYLFDGINKIIQYNNSNLVVVSNNVWKCYLDGKIYRIELWYSDNVKCYCFEFSIATN